MIYDPEAKARELIVRLNTEQPGITVRWLAAALAEARESGREDVARACESEAERQVALAERVRANGSDATAELHTRRAEEWLRRAEWVRGLK